MPDPKIKIKMKLVQVSKNVASFTAAPDATDEADLSPSGRSNYGQADLLVSNPTALAEIQKHQYFNFTLTPVDADGNELDDQEEEA